MKNRFFISALFAIVILLSASISHAKKDCKKIGAFCNFAVECCSDSCSSTHQCEKVQVGWECTPEGYACQKSGQCCSKNCLTHPQYGNICYPEN